MPHAPELFTKYDAGGKGALSWDDVQDLVYGQMNVRCLDCVIEPAARMPQTAADAAAQVNDPVGWIAARLEWWVLWLGAADSKGLVSKDKARL